MAASFQPIRFPCHLTSSYVWLSIMHLLCLDYIRQGLCNLDVFCGAVVAMLYSACWRFK